MICVLSPIFCMFLINDRMQRLLMDKQPPTTARGIFVNLGLLCLGIALLAGCSSHNSKPASSSINNAPYDPIAARQAASPSPSASPQGGANKMTALDGIKQLIIQKQYPQAEARLRLRIVSLPNDAIAWANLGLVLSETHRLDMAEKALRKAVSLNADLAAAHVRLAAVLKRQGKIEEALSSNKKAVEIDPLNTDAHYNLAIMYDLYYEDPVNASAHLASYLAQLEIEDKAATAWLKQLRRMTEKLKAEGGGNANLAADKPAIAATGGLDDGHFDNNNGN